MVKETQMDFGNGEVRTEFEDFIRRRAGKSQWRSEPTFAILHELYIFSMGALGTIIWGYGDLIYVWFKK